MENEHLGRIISKKCLYCSNTIKIYLSRIKQGRGKYCSWKCYSLAEKGINHSPKTNFKKGFTPWSKGKKLSREHRMKLSLKNIGRLGSFRGRKHTIESRRKMSNFRRTDNHVWTEDISPEDWKKHSIHIINSRRRNAEGTHYYREWMNLKKEYNYTCPCCGLSEPLISLTKDHIIPVVKGGTDYISNIQPLCRSCNAKKSYKIIEKYERKWEYAL